MRKTTTYLLITIIGVIVLPLFISDHEPVILSASGDLPEYSVDDLIERAELIVIGEVKKTLPVQWIGPSGKSPNDASPQEIIDARGLFTDSLLLVSETLKGGVHEKMIRVRSFNGETETVIWITEGSQSYTDGKTYLLFLREGTGPTSVVGPGYYNSVGAIQGTYEVVDDKAISAVEDYVLDEWILEDLIAYIENALQANP